MYIDYINVKMSTFMDLSEIRSCAWRSILVAPSCKDQLQVWGLHLECSLLVASSAGLQ